MDLQQNSVEDTLDATVSIKCNKPKNKKTKNIKDGKIKKRKGNKTKLRQDAREKGCAYIRTYGTIANPKQLQTNPCKKCQNKCDEISEQSRQNIFDEFWELSNRDKKDWIVNMTRISEIRRKRSKHSQYRDKTYLYFIDDGEGRRRVCLQFLMKTLDVTHKYIYNILTSALSDVPKDKVKKIPRTRTSQIDKDLTVDFIKSLPALPSSFLHRGKTKLYLPSEIGNINNLYKIYEEARASRGKKAVSKKKFSDIFNNDFDIGFHIPKTENCVICLPHKGKNFSRRPEIETHLEENNNSKRRLEFHQQLSNENKSYLCTSIDLNVYNTPYGSNVLLLYSKKYTVYNFCFNENSTKKGFCYTWGETSGKREANEISTILQKYITDVDLRGNIKHLILYSNSCSNYIRNQIVLAALHNSLTKAKHIDTIQINYLLSGHRGIMNNIQTAIDVLVKNTTIWAPSQWRTVFQLAQQDPSAYYVEELCYDDFKDFGEFSKHYFEDVLTDKIGQLRVATFKKSLPDIVAIKCSMAKNVEKDMILITGNTKPLLQKYYTHLPITTGKFFHLERLCDTEIIPKIFHHEYANFKHQEGIDTLVETDIEDEEY